MESGVLNNIALSLVLKQAETTMILQVCLFITQSSWLQSYVFLKNFLSTFIFFGTTVEAVFMDHPVYIMKVTNEINESGSMIGYLYFYNLNAVICKQCNYSDSVRC